MTCGFASTGEVKWPRELGRVQPFTKFIIRPHHKRRMRPQMRPMNRLEGKKQFFFLLQDTTIFSALYSRRRASYASNRDKFAHKALRLVSDFFFFHLLQLDTFQRFFNFPFKISVLDCSRFTLHFQGYCILSANIFFCI